MAPPSVSAQCPEQHDSAARPGAACSVATCSEGVWANPHAPRRTPRSGPRQAARPEHPSTAPQKREEGTPQCPTWPVRDSRCARPALLTPAPDRLGTSTARRARGSRRPEPTARVAGKHDNRADAEHRVNCSTGPDELEDVRPREQRVRVREAFAHRRPAIVVRWTSRRRTGFRSSRWTRRRRQIPFTGTSASTFPRWAKPFMSCGFTAGARFVLA